MSAPREHPDGTDSTPRRRSCPCRPCAHRQIGLDSLREASAPDTMNVNVGYSVLMAAPSQHPWSLLRIIIYYS